MTRALTFDDFRPDSALGQAEIAVDAELAAAWAEIEPEMPPDAEGRLPLGFLVALVMRGYLQSVTPRPPGNVHAGMEIEVRGEARLGETLTMEVRCLKKEERKGRRWVDFGVLQRAGARHVLDCRLTLIWAA